MTKVLYIEHDDDNLYMLKMRLERAGDFEVLAAEDSETGCRLALTERPDVILMDLEMPGTDRWEPVRTLKTDPHTRDIPIIGMSAYALDSERKKAIATGCDEFDVKPIELEHLIAAILRLLAKPKCDRTTNRIQDGRGRASRSAQGSRCLAGTRSVRCGPQIVRPLKGSRPRCGHRGTDTTDRDLTFRIEILPRGA
jgi:two-component system, cell cycle response regulator DivK